MFELLTGIDPKTQQPVHVDPLLEEVLELLDQERKKFGYSGWVIEGWSAWSGSGLTNHVQVRALLIDMLKKLKAQGESRLPLGLE